MKATVDIPDLLYRQVKARAAIEGRTVRDVTIQLYERWLAGDIGSEASPVDQEARVEAWIEGWKELSEEVGRRAVGSRSALEILLADRR